MRWHIGLPLLLHHFLYSTTSEMIWQESIYRKSRISTSNRSQCSDKAGAGSAVETGSQNGSDPQDPTSPHDFLTSGVQHVEDASLSNDIF